MKVQIIAHNGVGRGSRIISWATRGYSHVSLRFVGASLQLRNEISRKYGIRLTDDHEIESIQGKGVHDQPFVASGNQARFEFDCTEAQAVKIVLAACSLVGCKYDWRGIGGFALRFAKWQNPSKWFCSELVAWCLLQADIILMNMPCHWIQPNICVKTPTCRRVRETVG